MKKQTTKMQALMGLIGGLMFQVLPAKGQNAWYDQAVKSLEIIEQSFYLNSDGNHYRSTNPRNRLNFCMGTSGYEVRNVLQNSSEEQWKCSFSIEGINKGSGMIRNPETKTIANKTSLYYSGRYFTTEYLNSEEGLRQNFIVHQKPQGPENLKVCIQISTALEFQQIGNALVFKDRNSGKTLFQYDALKAWDAGGNLLQAGFNLKGSLLEIWVKDQSAQYPVTIDPLNHTSNWDVSAPGLLLSLPLTNANTNLLGYKMVMVGDVNGDTYNDVAIGCPGLVDIISGTGSLANVGAVFVFHGSATGLGTTPSNILQPTSLVAGALFGYSVAGADMDNDGFSDLVVGAPLDHVNIQVGIINQTGSVGRAYTFSGASMGTSNCAPSLTLELDLSCLNLINISNNALFGFSVAVVEDRNGDNRPEILVGAPMYAGLSLLAAKTGGAYVYYSSNTPANNYTTFSSLAVPDFSLLGIVIPGVTTINGLLFGYSVDGLGDYNGDGAEDIVVGAPAGVNLSSLTGILTGQVLGGQAYVYYGRTDNTGYRTNIGAELRAASGGLLGNAANLFGLEVRGLRDIAGLRTGGVVVGSPVGGLVPNLLTLTIQTGNIHVFVPQTASPLTPVTSDQVIETPRSNSILNVLNTLDLNLLFGTSIDNMYDVNCDGFPDLVVGEPLSSGTSLPLIQANAVGGSAHIYLGNSSGLFDNTPFYSAEATYGTGFLSVNAAALFGYSVAGGMNVLGLGTEPVMLVGSPSGALDFGAGLLNLGATLNTLFDFAAGDNGPGKSYGFIVGGCATPLATKLVSFTGNYTSNVAKLEWLTLEDAYTDRFVIEKSADGKVWTKVGEVKAKSLSQQARYQLTDPRPYAGLNYYRLTALQSDGKTSYDRMIQLRVATASTSWSDFNVYPNPAINLLNISTAFEGNVQIELYTLQGQNVYFTKQANESGLLKIQRSEMGNLQSGTYLLKIRSESGEVRYSRVTL